MNKNISVWRGDNTPPTQYHLWLKNNGKLYVNIDEKWQEIDKDSVAQITETLNQHATKLDNHQTALNDINTLHSKLWTPGKGNFSVITQGTKNSIGDDKSKGAIGDLSVAEGEKTTAKKTAAHAEGCLTVAEGFHSHAEGYGTRALGDDAHAEGDCTTAKGYSSHTEGYGTIANGVGAHAEGCYNIDNKNAIHSTGIGNSKIRKNAEYIYVKNNENNIELVDDPKNGYKYLIGVGGYDGISTDNTTYKSVQEVIADLTAHIEQLEKLIVQLPVVETPASGDTVVMEANKMYVITVGDSLTLTLAAPTDTTICNEYQGSFDTGSTAPTVTFPSNVIWAETPSVEANTHYEFNIRYTGDKYYGLIQAWNINTEESI